MTEIRPDGVVARDGEGKNVFFPADSVLLAAGLMPKAEEAEALRSDAYELMIIGDARKPGRVYDAVRQGFDAAMYLH